MTARARGRYQGVTQIVRFNWPLYATAAVLFIAGGCVISVISLPSWVKAILLCAISGAAFWLVMSLIIAHYIYDRASIYDGAWIQRAIRTRPSRWMNFHAGLDEFGDLLHRLFPGSSGRTVDFFHDAEMSEPSIRRARSYSHILPEAIHVDYRALPLSDNDLEAAFVLFSAHELRKHESRVRFLAEVRRVLQADGQIVLLEHLRDIPNFVAFGPGFLHFHSRRTWLRAIHSAGLAIAKEFTLTPFLRAFVLEKLPTPYV